MLVIKNQNEFEKLVKNGTVLIDFFTSWCGPCITQAKILADSAATLKNRYPMLKIVELDCDKLGNIADKYDIRSIPTLMFFINGKAYKMNPGVKGFEMINDFLKNHV